MISIKLEISRTHEIIFHLLNLLILAKRTKKKKNSRNCEETPVLKLERSKESKDLGWTKSALFVIKKCISFSPLQLRFIMFYGATASHLANPRS